MPLIPLPSTVWRLLLVLGVPAGMSAQGIQTLAPQGEGAVYLVVLCLLSELAALASLALVRPWGRMVPRWSPILAGRPVPRRVTLGAAWSGTVVLGVLWTPFLAWWILPHPDLTATGGTAIGLVYLPLVAWAPLLAMLTISFGRRTHPV
ncbi:MAG: hypothetical protein H0X12_01460 [Nocardioides sp.]|nr:hypothetical protein [Nocardioides sp.]